MDPSGDGSVGGIRRRSKRCSYMGLMFMSLRDGVESQISKNVIETPFLLIPSNLTPFLLILFHYFGKKFLFSVFTGLLTLSPSSITERKNGKDEVNSSRPNIS